MRDAMLLMTALCALCGCGSAVFPLGDSGTDVGPDLPRWWPRLPLRPAPADVVPSDEETGGASTAETAMPEADAVPSLASLEFGDDLLRPVFAALGLVAPTCSGDAPLVVPVAWASGPSTSWLLTGMTSAADPTRRFAVLAWDGQAFALDGYLSDAEGFEALVDDPARPAPWCRPASIVARSEPELTVLLAYDPSPGATGPNAVVFRRVGSSWQVRAPGAGDLGGPLTGTSGTGPRGIPHLFGPVPFGAARVPSWWWPLGLRNGAPDDVVAGYSCPSSAGWGGCTAHRLTELLELEGLSWPGGTFGEDLYAAAWMPLGGGAELLAFVVANGHVPGELSVPPLWRRGPGEPRFSALPAGDFAEVSQWQPMGATFLTLGGRLALAVTTNTDLLLFDPQGDRDPGFRSKLRLFDLGPLADAATGVVAAPVAWDRQGFASTPVLPGTGASWTPWAGTAQLSPGSFCAAHVPDAGGQPGLVPEGVRCVQAWTHASDGRPYLAPVQLPGLTPGLPADRFSAFGLDVPVFGPVPDPYALGHDAQGLAVFDANDDGWPDVLQEGFAGGLPVLRLGSPVAGAAPLVRFDAPSQGGFPWAILEAGQGDENPWLIPQGWSQLGARGPARDSVWAPVQPATSCATASLPDAGCAVTACVGAPATLSCAAP